MAFKYLLIFSISLLMTESALALRCGTRLVNTGDPVIKVLKFCGKPSSVQARTILRSGFPRLRNRTRRISPNVLIGDNLSDDELLFHQRSLIEVQVEEWTYNFGPNRIIRQIRFENGIVADILSLGYGY